MMVWTWNSTPSSTYQATGQQIEGAALCKAGIAPRTAAAEGVALLSHHAGQPSHGGDRVSGMEATHGVGPAAQGIGNQAG